MRLLAFAYACEPKAGSEPGAGWAFARMLGRIGETWVVTRANNQGAIEAALDQLPERPQLHFVYVDLPPRLMRWKKGQRGLRLYYLLWQALAVRRGRALHRQVGFSVVWHLTLANAWLGSLAPLVGATFVYGPVGGGVTMPWRLASTLGMRGASYEALRSAARGAGRYLNPVARIAWRRASLILTQNAATRDWLPRVHRSKAVVFPNIVLDAAPSPLPRRSPSAVTALFAGRLLPWKGVSLALDAVARVADARLIVCGRGPDLHRLRARAHAIGIAGRVSFRGQVPRDEILELMGTCDVFLFPSLHDEGGWAVAEARASGLPVICLDRGGPPLLGGRAVPLGTRADVVAGLAGALRDVGDDRFPAGPDLSFETRAEDLAALLRARLPRLGA